MGACISKNHSDNPKSSSVAQLQKPKLKIKSAATLDFPYDPENDKQNGMHITHYTVTPTSRSLNLNQPTQDFECGATIDSDKEAHNEKCKGVNIIKPRENKDPKVLQTKIWQLADNKMDPSSCRKRENQVKQKERLKTRIQKLLQKDKGIREVYEMISKKIEPKSKTLQKQN